MVLAFIVALAIFGGLDTLGDSSSWQFFVLLALAFMDFVNS